jgi:hypothetical protein
MTALILSAAIYLLMTFAGTLKDHESCKPESGESK